MDSDSSKNTESETHFDKKIILKNKLTDDHAQIHLKIKGDKISAAKIIGSFDIYQNYYKQQKNNSWQKAQDISFNEHIPFPFHFHIAFIQTFEKILKNSIEIPTRAKYLRTIILELERISYHLSLIGNLGNGFSFPMLSLKALSIQALILESLNELTKNPNKKSYLKVGGVTKDLDSRKTKKLLISLSGIKKDILNLRRVFYRNSILK